jgi:SHAQKYF class myb-like DNA-binding protein
MSFFPHAFMLVPQPPAERPAGTAELPAKWTSEEHSKFLKALEEVVDSSDGSDWQAIAQAVGRPEADVKRHAQHYFLKLEHERSIPEDSIVQVRAPLWVYQRARRLLSSAQSHPCGYKRSPLQNML